MVFVVGPTGSGKSALGLRLCSLLNGELVNADAMQMYEGAPIATNQPSQEELNSVVHHLVGFQDPKDPISVQVFVDLAVAAITDIHRRGRVAVVVGGTCYYVLALYFVDWLVASVGRGKESEQASFADCAASLALLDPVASARIDPHDERKIRRALEIAQSGALQSELFARQNTRPRFERSFVVVLEASGAEFEAGLAARVDAMLAAGLEREMENLKARWGAEEIDCQRGVWQSIGLKELLTVGEGSVRERVTTATVRYAKKQTRQLRNSLCPLLDHVLVPFSSAQTLAPHLARWIASLEEPDSNVKLVSRIANRSDKKVERLECCGKIIMGAACIAEHVKSKAHKQAKRKQQTKSV